MPRAGGRRTLARWGPPLGWMAVISLASTEALAASETSRLVGPLLRWLFPGAAPATLELLHAGIRKLGHLAEFGILALLWYRALAWEARRWEPKAALRALSLTAAGALLDETHQLFEPSRTASLADVGWDLLGGGPALLWRRHVARRSGAPPGTSAG